MLSPVWVRPTSSIGEGSHRTPIRRMLSRLYSAAPINWDTQRGPEGRALNLVAEQESRLGDRGSCAA